MLPKKQHRSPLGTHKQDQWHLAGSIRFIKQPLNMLEASTLIRSSALSTFSSKAGCFTARSIK